MSEELAFLQSIGVDPARYAYYQNLVQANRERRQAEIDQANEDAQPSTGEMIAGALAAPAGLATGLWAANGFQTPSWLGGAPEGIGLVQGGTGIPGLQAGSPLVGGSVPGVTLTPTGGVAESGAGALIDAGADPAFFDAGGPIGSNIGPYLQGGLGALGLGAGLYGAYNAYEAGDPLGGAISGAGAGAGGLALAGALGASTGGLAIPVILGASALGLGGGLLGGRETGIEILQNRIADLEERGITDPFAQERLSGYGATAEDLIAREQAKLAEGRWGNPIFAESRDEADLLPSDTWGGLMWLEDFGNEYLQGTTEQQRRDLNQAALNEGLIREARGQLQWYGDEERERAQELWNDIVVEGNPLEGSARSVDDEIAAILALQEQAANAPQAIVRPLPAPIETLPGTTTGLDQKFNLPIEDVAMAVEEQMMLPPRSTTLSPGIDLQGNPIFY